MDSLPRGSGLVHGSTREGHKAPNAAGTQAASHPQAKDHLARRLARIRAEAPLVGGLRDGAFELAVEMHLVTAEPFQLVGVKGFTEGLLPDTGQFLDQMLFGRSCGQYWSYPVPRIQASVLSALGFGCAGPGPPRRRMRGSATGRETSDKTPATALATSSCPPGP